MLVRDTRDEGVEVFLMRRHRAMEFVGGVIVFPGGGVDDRDRNADIDWHGPPPSWWAERFGVDEDLALALVCAAARETFEESGVLFAGPADDPDGIVSDAGVYARDARAPWPTTRWRSATSCVPHGLVLRADLLRPWANWVTPKEERTRRYDTFFFVGALPEGQRADGENTESDQVGWATPEQALARLRRTSQLPAAADLDAAGLAGRPHRRRGARRCSVRSSPYSPLWLWRTVIGRSSSSTVAATTPRAPDERRDAGARVRQPSTPTPSSPAWAPC